LEGKGFTAPGGSALRFEVEVPLSALGREAVGDEGGTSDEVSQVLSKESEGSEAVTLLRPIEEMRRRESFGHGAVQKFLEVQPAPVGLF
jgi:hypothetical protein